MNNSQVCHLWANQARETGKGSNLFFEGETIFSYGRHFPIATFTGTIDETGAQIVLFNADTYSNSTARHQTHVRRALHGLNVRVIECLNVLIDDHESKMQWFENEFNDSIIKAMRARTYAAHHYENAARFACNARAYGRAFMGAIPQWALQGISEELTARIKAEKDKKESAKREAIKKERAEFEKRVVDWQQGNDSLDGIENYSAMPVYLRMKDSDTVETTRGASVTLENARKLYVLVRHARGRTDGARENIRRDMPIIDGFNVRNIDHDGNVTIGCHHLEWAQIEQFAKLQGWI